MAARRALGLRRAARLAAAEVPEEAERWLRKRQEAAVRLRRLQKALEPPRTPERTLSRQAMEQIRYLSQEFPEDWPVSRLAQGFQVQPEVICRVLKSRFAPSWERSLKQDGRVWARQSSSSGGQPAGHGPLQPQALLTRESTFKLLPASTRRVGAPQQATRKANMAPLDSPALVTLPGEQAGKGQGEPCSVTSLPGTGSQVVEEEQGRFLSMDEMEQLAAEGWESRLQVVQRGREFFDAAGNLLYRIPAASPGN